MILRFVFAGMISLAGTSYLIIPGLRYDGTTEEINCVGSNVMSLELNDHPVTFNKMTSSVSHQGDLFYVKLRPADDDESHVTFVIRSEDITPGNYEMANPSENHVTFYLKDSDCHYSSDEVHHGMLMIHKYDQEHNILSASFDLIATSYQCDGLVRIHQGFFDVSFEAIQQ